MSSSEREPLQKADPQPPPGGTNCYAKKKTKNPEEAAGFISRIMFFYITPFFIKGYRKNLDESDLYAPLSEQESRRATEELREKWDDEKMLAKEKNREPSFLKAIFRTYGRDLIIYGILLFIEELIKLFQPIFMGRIIRYFRFDTPLDKNEAIFSAAGVAITAILINIIHHPYLYGLQKISLRLKIAASGLLAEKGFGLSSAALRDTSVGLLVNLLSSDVMKFDMSFIFFHYLWASPIMFFAYSGVIWWQCGGIALCGFLAYFILSPIQGHLSRKMGLMRRQVGEKMDKRISVMNEILNGIRLIKMYSWEDAFADIVDHLRKEEISVLRRQATCQSLLMGLFWPSTKMVILFSALGYFFTGELVLAEPIFVASALFNACRLPVMLFLPLGIAMLNETKVTSQRVQSFLELEDFEPIQSTKHTSRKDPEIVFELRSNGVDKAALLENGDSHASYASWCHLDQTASNNARVEMRDFSATWARSSAVSSDSTLAVKGISLTASRGRLVGVIGPVGAGKSSLLASILRETTRISGELFINGKIAYCSQDAWIFGGTVRDNILFGKEYNAALYDEVMEMSALKQDLIELPNSDLTSIGDRGITLSGGQRARLALARALYSQADIFLLDDPLSAVDAAVGRFIFDRCICQYLKDRVVILVTHQLQFIGKADEIVLMKDGAAVVQGSPKELKESNSKLVLQLIQETARTYGVRRSESAASGHSDDEGEIIDDVFDGSLEAKTDLIDKKEDPLLTEEDRAEGAVPWSVYWRYIRSMGAWYIIPAMIFTVLVQVLFNFTDYWLNIWTGASERAMRVAGSTRMSDVPEGFEYHTNIFGYKVHMELSTYCWIFSCSTLLVVLASIIRCVWVRLLETIASEVLHKQMFHAVVNTDAEFFDTNPIGRVLNRFSKDIHTMDDPLAFVFFEFLLGILGIMGLVIVIVILNPYSMLMCVPLFALFAFIRAFYLATSRDVKRIEAISRSPLYTHISAVMKGLMTVRAYGCREMVIQTYHDKMNINSTAFLMTLTTSRWFALQIDWIVSIFVSFVAFACVFSPILFSSGDVALMLVYSVQLTGFLSWIIRQSAEMQNGMVSVERIVNYCSLPSEHDEKALSNVPASWPQDGEIKFDHFCLTYGERGASALKDISVHIHSQQKVGVVGRTGAGKSSLLRALFRMNKNTTGRIYIDGVDISTIPLRVLRAHLAIIPQEPVLFVGTLRQNLDPFNEYSDEQLWSALDKVELKDAVRELSKGLLAEMNEGGANFSVGQRQLVCLARALLRNSKILVIDEATANVDAHTDELIQKTLRNAFAGSTVLTIAHRLHTIMDSDRVMVLRDGQLAEFEHPHILLENPNTFFSSLVAETGRETTAQLKSIAKKAYEKQTHV